MSEDLIAVAREDLEAFNAGDWDRLSETMTEDSVYEEPGTGRRLQGKEANLQASREWKAAFPDVKGTMTDAFACGDRVAVRVTWEGTHEGPLTTPDGGQIAATGRKVTVQACQLYRFEGDKVAEACHFFDLLGMMEQLGVTSESAPAEAGA
jgi:steroid delta-isomerase-like uncharacterized protein